MIQQEMDVRPLLLTHAGFDSVGHFDQRVEIAELPMTIRGYGHVKHDNVQEAHARLEHLLTQWPVIKREIAA